MQIDFWNNKIKRKKITCVQSPFLCGIVQNKALGEAGWDSVCRNICSLACLSSPSSSPPLHQQNRKLWQCQPEGPWQSPSSSHGPSEDGLTKAGVSGPVHPQGWKLYDACEEDQAEKILQLYGVCLLPAQSPSMWICMHVDLQGCKDENVKLTVHSKLTWACMRPQYEPYWCRALHKGWSLLQCAPRWSRSPAAERSQLGGRPLASGQLHPAGLEWL